MAQSVCFSESESRSEFLINKIIDFVFVSMANNQRMSEVHSIVVEISNWKNSLDPSSNSVTHLFAKKNR
jgi:hypothetical protein